ncbi:hypothetical protein EZ216_19465 [Ramlibacter humi]|uniref:Uncharacterized protein n=1 Tax=Ramlibacter humi TaxID=2530451 RepID=A0A4Z0BCQ4_9BURK|nr:hypothetical protein EZ216_19465 [Ramlibacter humi]
MLLLLSIDRDRAGAYVTQVRHGSVPVHTSAPAQQGLAEAISSTAARIPQAYAGFVEVRYAGVCGGTFPVRDLCEAKAAASVAERMVEVVAALRNRRWAGTARSLLPGPLAAHAPA